MRIGELAGQTGASVRSLRYYEEHGLLSSRRTASGQRRYEPDAIDRVRLLRRLYTAGLTSTTISTLLPCVNSPSKEITQEALQVMTGECERIGAQIAELVTTRDDLTYLINAATAFHREQLDTDSTSQAPTMS